MTGYLPHISGLRVHRIKTQCEVLGPGKRAVLWFQGCALDCPGCIAYELNRSRNFQRYSAESLCEEVCAISGIEGVTLSGGDPFDQPLEELAEFLTRLRQRSSLTVLCYTGRTIEELLSEDNPRKAIHRRILGDCDLLIDGPYVAEQHDGTLWRGSANQRLWNLSQAYDTATLAKYLTASRSLEIELTPSNELLIAGIPPPQFIARLRERLSSSGYVWNLSPSHLPDDQLDPAICNP